jgi:hypothetical protein
VLLVDLVLFEALCFVIGVWFTFHTGYSLKATWLIYWENQDDVLNCSKSVAQLSRWACSCSPSTMSLWFLKIFRRIWFDNKEPGSSTENILGIIHPLIDLIEIKLIVKLSIIPNLTIDWLLLVFYIKGLMICLLTFRVLTKSDILIWAGIILLRLELLLPPLVAVAEQAVEINRLLLILCVTQLLSHLFHQRLNHVDIGNLGIIEVIFNFVKVLLRQALICLVDRPLLLIFDGVMEHTFFVSVNAEPV